MKTILNPNLYHGKNKKSNFFEGWYYKIVSNDKKTTLAFIPGISFSESSHCFIQILQGEKRQFNYCKFPSSKFNYSNSPFYLDVDKNFFSLDKITLNIDQDNVNISGSITFKNLTPWKDSLINPGSMGFYNYLKFMECYSQVCALDGFTSGSLNINNSVIDFNGGKVYIEKNWGKSFPLEWLWIQSNCFKDNRATVTCSVGEIPFPIKSFRGFLIGVTIDDQFYKFTTINRSKLHLTLNNNDVTLIVTNKNLQLTLITHSSIDDFILCYGPINGKMSPFVNETLTAKVYMELLDKNTNKILYSGEGLNTGIEFGGKLMDTLECINKKSCS